MDDIAPIALLMTEVVFAQAVLRPFHSVLFVFEMSLMLKCFREGPFQDVCESEVWRGKLNGG